MNKIRQFIYSSSGVTLVEYGIAISVGVVLGIGAFTLLAAEITASVNAAGNAMPN